MADTGFSTSTQTRRPAMADGRRPMRRTFTEAKAGFKTTEFWVMLAFVAGVLIATYSDGDSLAREDGWLYAALAAGAYMLSRGFAKLGVREPYDDTINLD